MLIVLLHGCSCILMGGEINFCFTRWPSILVKIHADPYNNQWGEKISDILFLGRVRKSSHTYTVASGRRTTHTHVIARTTSKAPPGGVALSNRGVGYKIRILPMWGPMWWWPMRWGTSIKTWILIETYSHKRCSQ